MYCKLDAHVEELIVGDIFAIQYVLNQLRNVAKHNATEFTTNRIGRRAAGSRRALL
jgi:hypothetical protein